MKIGCIIFVFLFYITAHSGFAQSTFKITGKVLDSLQQPIDNAVISLIKYNNGALVKTTFTEKGGDFDFIDLSIDSFKVSVTQLGYTAFISRVIVLDSIHLFVQLPDIILKSNSKKLDEVVIISKESFIERKLDRIIVNPDALISNAGGNALDILAKSPGVIIDNNGGIKLKGKSGVVVFIDDKPTYLSGTELENYLKSLPANSIKQIEIISNPPAKYEAAGNAGIINIKTKKSKLRGLNGNVSANYAQGRYGRTNDNVSLNYSNQKIAFFSNINYNNQTIFQDLTINRRYKNNDLTTKSLFNQRTYIKVNNQSVSSRLGLDYYINNKTTLGITARGIYNPSSHSKYNYAQVYDSAGILSSNVIADNSDLNVFKNGTVNLNLRHVFDSLGRQLTVDLDYVAYSGLLNQQFKNDVVLADGTNIYKDTQTGELPSDISIYAFKSDLEIPFKNNSKLDAGIKTSFTKTDNDAVYMITQNDITQPNYNLSNHFKYNEMINAAYMNYTKAFNRFDLQAGLRFESTILNGFQLGNIIKPESQFTRTYHNLFPTFYASYKLDSASNHVLVFSYGKRINRPFYKDLNPFVSPLDKYTYYSGNPYVKPTFAHNFSLAHSFKNLLTTTLSYNNTIDNIQETIEIANGIYYSRPGNIGSSQQYNISLESSIPFAKWLNTTIYSELVYSEFKSKLYTQTLDAKGTYWFINANNIFQFKKGWSAELSGQYISDFIDSQFLFGDFGFITIGFQKKILKNMGSLKMSLSDVLHTNKIRGTINNLELTDAHWNSINDSRILSVTFSYRFGKNTNSKAKHNTNGSDAEQKRIK